eukprot:749436-Hanusia_phi.AAC.2
MQVQSSHLHHLRHHKRHESGDDAHYNLIRVKSSLQPSSPSQSLTIGFFSTGSLDVSHHPSPVLLPDLHTHGGKEHEGILDRLSHVIAVEECSDLRIDEDGSDGEGRGVR